ncbi:DUF4114 domain-containing protein [Nostoc sp. ChiQUE01b]|uniref:DUF4114 domain-containing protein n=1 Tax=Nostoc sp. ChiQUE01b TaxID=3075376 RepID=UPI002AD4CBAE|nr:DUF4114 domain-containing protein [Nostoc sp. ChiQUE01b]MDZ8257721.1 VCBS domain-containing protein [Nostoc sp. ChiQUE01b]
MLTVITPVSAQVIEGEVLSDVVQVYSDSPEPITIELISDDFTTDPNPLIASALEPDTPIFVSITSKDDFVAQGDRNDLIVQFKISSSTEIYVVGVEVTIKDNDTAGVTITETLGNTAVTEGGATDSYSVVLTSQPTANVTVNLNGEEQLSFNTTTLTFTPQNWNVAQAVTVTAVDDGLIEGNHTQTISHTATSADASYGGISISSVNVNITDNDKNYAPSFTAGINQTAAEDSGAQTVANWATNISPGSADEASQTVNFQITNDRNELFSVQPAIDASGNLTYTPAANANGSAVVTAILQDDGGTVDGGVDTSAAQTFTITINPVNDTATISGIATGAITEDLNVVNGNLSATDNLSVNDIDTDENKFNTTVTSASDNLGSLSITEAGVWNYSVANSAVQFLGAGITKTEVFGVKSLDSTAFQDIAIIINGSNDAPTDLFLSKSDIDEDSAALSTIGLFSTIDTDVNDSSTYSLVDGDGANDNDAFMIDGNQLKIKASPNFETKQSYKIRVKTTDPGGLSYQKALAIAVNDLDIPNRLTTNDDDIFNITGNDTKATLQVTLLGRNSNLGNELGVFIVDDATGTINGIAPGADGYAQAALERAQVIFFAITNVPNGFNTSNLTRSVELDSGANLRFYLVKNNSTTDAILAGINPITDVSFTSTTTLKVSNLGNDEFRIAWEDGTGNSTNDFQDLVVKIKSSNQSVPLGAKLQGNSQAEIIDLKGVMTPVTANFSVYREAAFNNFVGFYQIADENGGIDTNGDSKADIFPGQSGYTQAAVRGRVAGIDLTVINQSTATYTGSFVADGIFAPFLIVNGKPDAILDNNSNAPAVYFPFIGANSDKHDHIRLLGDNIFGFEDLLAGGDRDFNDIIVQFNPI